MNTLYIVAKNGMSLDGEQFEDIEGFDYKSDELEISVRKADKEIRIFGKLIKVDALRQLVFKH